MTETRGRRVELDGCFNFRDLGGWQTENGRTVRWGRLFRSDAVHLMTEADAVCAREELGLRTMLDLRNDLEIETGGIGPLAESARRVHVPLSSRPRGAPPIDSAVTAARIADRSPETMVAGYTAILETSAPLIVEAVTTLASVDALPAVFFCAAGKDRTGVLSAVVLGALGVRDADIVEDYVLTDEAIEPIIVRFASTPGSPDFYRDLPPRHFAPHAETMERFVEVVRRTYGGFGEYLLAKGVSKEALEGLSGTLLEPPAEI